MTKASELGSDVVLDLRGGRLRVVAALAALVGGLPAGVAMVERATRPRSRRSTVRRLPWR